MRRAAACAALLAIAAVTGPAAAEDGLPALGRSQSEDRARAVTCMADAIAYEAGFETIEGQQAVAQVIMNRVHNARFPNSVCGVVFQGSERRTGCQFTFTCDNSMRHRLPDRLFATARGIAEDALDQRLPDRVQGATYYHAFYVSPRWAPSMVKLRQIGAHIFYRSPVDTVPNQAYAGIEPTLTALAGVQTGNAATPALRKPMTQAPPSFTLWGLAVPAHQVASPPPPSQDARQIASLN